MAGRESWQIQAEALQHDLALKFPKEWDLPRSSYPLPLDVSDLVQTSGLLTASELHIIAHDATGLRDAIVEKKYSSAEVVEAFVKAAAVCHHGTNCLMDFFPEEARERAKWLDGQMERTGRPVGPLHGVPVSVKGHFDLHSPQKGLTMGVIQLSSG